MESNRDASVCQGEVVVNDLMQHDYRYRITEKEGCSFHPDFQPGLSPEEMLTLGVFGGKYMTECKMEYPAEWFRHAELCHEFHNPDLNCFGVLASQPLWLAANGWIHQDDPRGFLFQCLRIFRWNTRMILRQIAAGMPCAVMAQLKNIVCRRFFLSEPSASGFAAMGVYSRKF